MSDAPSRRIDPPPDFLADPALAAVLDALPEARVVGGAVRDTLTGIPVADIDLAMPRRPEAVEAALAAAGLRSAPTGLDHGTITAISGGRGFEITTLRRDVATDGRHAQIAFTEDWREDAARRDFTINAMSMTRDGAVFDYFGGADDLAAGRLRFVGDPRQRLVEDWLRALRFFRFYTRYAREPIDITTFDALASAAAELHRLSAERVWSELKRILAAPDPRASLALMHRLGLLVAVLPEGVAPDRLDILIAAGVPADPLLRLAALLDGDAATLAERLRLSSAERERLTALRAGPAPAAEADDAALRRELADTPADILAGRAFLAGEAMLARRIRAMEIPVFPLAGRDALALGLKPGPEIGLALARVREWWLAGGCLADAASCRAELARRLGG